MLQKVCHECLSVVYTIKLSRNTLFMKCSERNISQCILLFRNYNVEYHKPYWDVLQFLKLFDFADSNIHYAIGRINHFWTALFDTALSVFIHDKDYGKAKLFKKLKELSCKGFAKRVYEDKK